MSLSNFLRCCFPKSRDQITSDKEENVPDNSHTSDDKKRESLSNSPQKEESGNFVKSRSNIKEITFNSNANMHLDQKKQDLYSSSFSSFGGTNKMSINGTVKSNNHEIKENKESIDINIHTNKEIVNNQTKDNSANKSNLDNSVISRNKKIDETFDIANNSNRLISEEEIKTAPVLIVEETQGEMLRNNKLVINAAGLATGLRKAKDGLVFFGTAGKNKEEYFLNDVELNCVENETNSNRMFYIYFKKETNKFYLKNYNKTKVKMHIKLVQDLYHPIIKKEIILLDEMYFQLIPHSDGKLEIINLGLARVSTDRKKNSLANTKYIFDTNEYKIVTIGRDPNCTISFPGDKSFSKIHTSIFFDSDNKYWKMKDGSIDKSSTNGTWLFANHSFEIVDNTIFQFGSSHFLIKMQMY